MMHFYFIGVTTGQSEMVQLFPLWVKALDMKLDLVGIDIPLNARPSQYLAAVTHIKNDSHAIGAVVTTYKTKFFEYAFSLFDKFDALAEVTKEVCTIIRRGTLVPFLWHHSHNLGLPLLHSTRDLAFD